MRGPAFEKNFAPGNSLLGEKLERLQAVPGRAPAVRTKFAQGVVFPANPLQIKQEMTLARAQALVPRRERTGRPVDEQVADARGGEDKVARQITARRIHQTLPGRLQFAGEGFP